MEQAIFIAVLLVISFLNWGLREGGFRRLAGGDPDDEPTPRRGTGSPPPVRRPSGPERGGDDELRKFLEALGLPTDAAPPAPAKPPPPPVAVPPPPIPTPRPVTRPPRPAASAPVSQRRPRAVPTPRVVQPARLTFAQEAAAPGAAFPTAVVRSRESTEAYRIGGPKPASPSRDRLAALLSSPENLRNAVLLREVLGEPVALRES